MVRFISQYCPFFVSSGTAVSSTAWSVRDNRCTVSCCHHSLMQRSAPLCLCALGFVLLAVLSVCFTGAPL